MILGIELREDAVVAVAADEGGAVVARHTRKGLDSRSAADAARAVASRKPFERLGVALRDLLDPAAAEVAKAAAAAAGITTPPRVVTKGTAVALGESWCGAAKGASHVVALIADHSVHAGIVVHGQPFEGSHGLAAAAGWLALNPVEREDYRKLGCLEAEIGAPGIVRRLVWRLKSGDTSRVLEMAGGDMSAITVGQIFDAARERDGVAVSIVRDTARYIGMALGNLAAIIDPDVLVVGGFIADAGDLLIEPSRTEALRRAPATTHHVLTIVPATLGEDAAALGAARAAMLAT